MHSAPTAARGNAAPSPTLRRRLAGAARLLATPLRPSHYLELLNPLWATHALRARVERVTDETADARTVTLRPGRRWQPHRPGQYLAVGVSIDGVRHTRTYSISSPAAVDGCIDITVKAVDGGRVSGFLVRDLQPGTYLSIGLPQGDFVLPAAAPPRALFLTAGSGITPVMSMLRGAALPDAVHLHYAPRPADVIFADTLQGMAEANRRYRLHRLYTRTGGGAARRFSAGQLEACCPDWREREVWACGPPALLAAVEAHWQAAGLAHRLHVERFVAALAPLPEAAEGGVVCFAASRRTVDADGRTPLLHVAERAGLAPAHGCRMGICHTCDATLVAGRVRDLRNGALLEAGQKVQVCVCAAAGDVEIAL